jgi:hypothetical protein
LEIWKFGNLEIRALRVHYRQSARSALIGSTPAARRAGRHAASMAVAESSTAIVA